MIIILLRGKVSLLTKYLSKKSFIKITKVHLPQASQVSREVAFSQENDGRSKRYFESSTCKMPMILSTRALLQSLTRQPNLALASLLRLCRLPSSEGALRLCKIPTSNLQMRFVCSLSLLLEEKVACEASRMRWHFHKKMTEGVSGILNLLHVKCL